MKAYLDRFEGNKAVLIVRGESDSLLLPRKLLPAGAREGDILTIFVKIDEPETKRRREEIETLQEEDD